MHSSQIKNECQLNNILNKSSDEEFKTIEESKNYQNIFLEKGYEEFKEAKINRGDELNSKSFDHVQSSDGEYETTTVSKKYQNIFLDISSSEKSPQDYKNCDSSPTFINEEFDTSIIKEETWRGLGGNPYFELDNGYLIAKKTKNRPGKYMTHVPEIDKILNNRKLRSNMNSFEKWKLMHTN